MKLQPQCEDYISTKTEDELARDSESIENEPRNTGTEYSCNIPYQRASTSLRVVHNTDNGKKKDGFANIRGGAIFQSGFADHRSPTSTGDLPETSPTNATPPHAADIHRRFWQNEISGLSGPAPQCSFANANRRVDPSRTGHHRVSVVIDASLNSGIRHFCDRFDISPESFTLAVLGVLLSLTLETDTDFYIAIPLGENAPHSNATASFLPVKFGLMLEERASDFVLHACAKQQEVLRHAEVEFAFIDQLAGSGNSLRESMCAGFFYNGLNHQSDHFATGPFDMELQIVERCDPVWASATLTVPERLYTHFDAKGLLDRYINVLRNILTHPSVLVKDLRLWDPAELRLSIALGKGPRVKLNDWSPTLLHRIDEIARINPDDIAARDSAGNTLTYTEMLQRVTAIAIALVEGNSIKGDRIAVYCEPGIDTLCSLLAITRIGCVYVPLDLRNPTQRLAKMVRDCNPRLIIYHDASVHSVSGLRSADKGLLNISALSKDIDGSVPPPIISTSSDPAFVLYTSGSTGTPKGVILSHGNFLGQIAAVTRELGLEKERVLQQSSLGFDTSLHQIFVALVSGGTVVIAQRDIRGDPLKISDLMVTEQVTFTLGVPSEYSVLLRYSNSRLGECRSWKYAVCGGERMTVALKREFASLNPHGPVLISCYGPTEVALASSFGKLSYSEPALGACDDNSPVGFTLPNYSVYILDKNMKPVPTGYPGEIYIAGVGVASGYLNNDLLSAEVFIPNPFAGEQDKKNGWTHMYKTGDKGRLLPDGALSFIGRIRDDSQVKLRGIRIELEEISNVIIAASEGAIHLASVIVKGSFENKYMVGFVTFSPDKVPTDSTIYLRRLLRSLPLPTYMRPVSLVPLDSLPVNINGKRDTRALNLIPLPGLQQTDAVGGEIAGPTETRLMQLWRDIIMAGFHKRDCFPITLRSDFFEVGGNSLLLIELQRQIYDVFGRAIPWTELFPISVLCDMAAYIDRTQTTPRLPLVDWNIEIEECFEAVERFPGRNSGPASLDIGSTKEVLLTGSTGFLGNHLLRELIANTDVSKVHAVAVRRHYLSRQANTPNIPPSGCNSPKVRVWPGDLGASGLGLTGADMDYLANKVDVIVHNGADVSFLKSYPSLRAANVGSTIELCRIALRRNIPFHFVSSAGVLRLTSESEICEETSVAEHPPPIDGSDGYIASKWVCEQLLEKACKRLGLPVHIHRPTTITGDGVPAMDIMANLLRFSRLMKSVPDFPEAQQRYINMVRVEEVAQSILQEVLSPGSHLVLRDVKENNSLHEARSRNGQDQVRWSHHAGPSNVSLQCLGDYLQEESKVLITKVDMKEWVTEAVKHGMADSVAQILNTPAAARGDGLTVPRLIFGKGRC
jgi:amino acid adenylation domain-containing protein/thioester reductase-like protein